LGVAAARAQRGLGEKISRQARRLERAAEARIGKLMEKEPPSA